VTMLELCSPHFKINFNIILLIYHPDFSSVGLGEYMFYAPTINMNGCHIALINDVCQSWQSALRFI
jgi:hypothetical protein